MTVKIKKTNGELQLLDNKKITKYINKLCEELHEISQEDFINKVKEQLFDGIDSNKIYDAALLVAKSMIEFEPEYNYLGARCLLSKLYKEIFHKSINTDINSIYKTTFKNNIQILIDNQRLSSKLLEFDLDKLASYIVPERDRLFKLTGLQIVYDRYLIHLNNMRMETPQAFYMRVAMGLCLEENDKEYWVKRIYDKLSTHLYSPSTPTLFNSGTCHSQLSSCFLAIIDDDLESILGSGCHAQGLLSKWAGGLAASVTKIRATNSYIKGTNGPSQGLIPFVKIYNSVTQAINQGSKRSGSQCLYLEPWHLDVEDFVDLRKNTGDERRRCHDLHTALWFPDEFFRRLENDEDWYLFSPDETPELHELFGEEFDIKYKEYIKKANKGLLKQFKIVKCKILWKKILTSLSETGHPWITFKDPSNIRYTNQHVGIVHNSNLCTEIMLHNKPTIYKKQQIVDIGETAVCNLASINLKEHCKDGQIDYEKLIDTIDVCIRGLDNTITNNYYPTLETEKANTLNRPIGMGIMGLHDVLHDMNLVFDSDEALELSNNIMEFISFHAIKNSIELSKQRGTYATYANSLWSQGILPIDTYKSLQKYRKNNTEINLKLDWEDLRKLVMEYGIRNSCLMAIAPTATIAWITGCSPSIEPDFSVLFTYTNLSGNFPVINESFVKKMKTEGLWNKKMLGIIKEKDGDVSEIQEIPLKIRKQFRTAFQLNQKKLIDGAAARQKWIDMGQSLNIYYEGSSLRQLSNIYTYAWESMLKTTYYLRTKGASSTEKITMNIASLPEEKVCNLGGDCESCQ